MNRRSALTIQIIGKGRVILTKFCAVMNMQGPVAKKSFQIHVEVIACLSRPAAEAEMKKAVE